MDELTEPFGEAAMRVAHVVAGERVIDVGCGCGATSIALAARVGSAGAVLGVDVSRPMLELARQRSVGLSNLRFEEGDASVAPLPGGQDVLYSRFGMMFFAAPVAAFAHMRRALSAGGRAAFVCWQAARDNLWASVPVQAARTALGLAASPGDPHAPGPFAFADVERVRGILTESGFSGVEVEAFEHPMAMGDEPRAAAEAAARLGPVARLAREAGPDSLPRIIDAVETALRPLAAKDGKIALPGRAWILSAKTV